MKIVNATWELRNLGKRTLELTLEKSDFRREPEDIYEEIENAEKDYRAEYTVVKVKAGNPQIGWELQKHGFWHIETQIYLKAVREDIEYIANKYETLFEDVSLQRAESKTEIGHIQDEIRKGIFTTDRIAMDPYFGIEIANRRYANWVGDEVKHKGNLYYTISNNEKVGFSLYKIDGTGLLGGVFIGCAKVGPAGDYFLASLQFALHTKTNKFYATVSSNNIKILQLHEMFGYRVQSMAEVYVKHDFTN